MYQAGTRCVAQSPGAGQGAPTVPLTAGACTESLTDAPLVINERQPVIRFIDGWAGVLVMFLSSCSGIRTSVL